VVEREYLSTSCLSNDEMTDINIERQGNQVFAACLHERPQVTAIVFPGMMVIIIGDRSMRVNRIHESKVKLTAVCFSRADCTLIHVIEKLQDDLVGDEQPQQTRVAAMRQNPEQCRAVEMGALAGKRIKRLFADGRVWDTGRSSSPDLYLTGTRS
jgi:hypothetical protein